MFNKSILPPSTVNIIQTYWLAGFADANSTFSIFISKNYSPFDTHSHELEFMRKTGYKVNVTIPFRVTQKNGVHSPELLSIIQSSLGGINYQTTDKNGTVNRFSTVSFNCAKSVAFYFDKFHLMNNSKWLIFLY